MYVRQVINFPPTSPWDFHVAWRLESKNERWSVEQEAASVKACWRARIQWTVSVPHEIFAWEALLSARRLMLLCISTTEIPSTNLVIQISLILVLGVQSIVISQHWFKQWFSAKQATCSLPKQMITMFHGALGSTNEVHQHTHTHVTNVKKS